MAALNVPKCCAIYWTNKIDSNSWMDYIKQFVVKLCYGQTRITTDFMNNTKWIFLSSSKKCNEMEHFAGDAIQKNIAQTHLSSWIFPRKVQWNVRQAWPPPPNHFLLLSFVRPKSRQPKSANRRARCSQRQRYWSWWRRWVLSLSTPTSNGQIQSNLKMYRTRMEEMVEQ